jgi:hypothetical protein
MVDMDDAAAELPACSGEFSHGVVVPVGKTGERGRGVAVRFSGDDWVS